MIEQGHIRVGTDVVKDPAFLVSRTLEDFVTWVDSSKIRKHVMEYNDLVCCQILGSNKFNLIPLFVSARRL